MVLILWLEDKCKKNAKIFNQMLSFGKQNLDQFLQNLVKQLKILI